MINKSEMSIKQIKQAIGQLTVKDRIKLIESLEKETWARRLGNTVNTIRRKVKKPPSSKEIRQLSEKARKKVSAKSQSRH